MGDDCWKKIEKGQEILIKRKRANEINGRGR